MVESKILYFCFQSRQHNMHNSKYLGIAIKLLMIALLEALFQTLLVWSSVSRDYIEGDNIELLKSYELFNMDRFFFNFETASVSLSHS